MAPKEYFIFDELGNEFSPPLLYIPSLNLKRPTFEQAYTLQNSFQSKNTRYTVFMTKFEWEKRRKNKDR